MYYPREEEPNLRRMLEWKEALALIGPRRAGKTTLALRLLETWKAEGNEGTYLDMEAMGAPNNAAELSGKIAEMPKGSLIVIDEAQVVEGWVKVVREEIERKERHVLITGSSASLLSKEIASALAGRAMPENVLPLSYRDAKKWGIASLQQYMDIGGYPECVLRPNDATKLHKVYFELTVLRDVAARKGIREIKPLGDLAMLLLSEPGKKISAKKTAEAFGISQPTLRSFVDALNDAFLILSVPPYLRSPRERLVADARHYAYDTGLQKSMSISVEADDGRRLENVVAIELVRRGYTISHLSGEDYECDFIAQKPGNASEAIQVWSGSGNVPEREWRGLEKGMNACGGAGLLLSREPIKEKGTWETRTVEDWILKMA